MARITRLVYDFELTVNHMILRTPLDKVHTKVSEERTRKKHLIEKV